MKHLLFVLLAVAFSCGGCANSGLQDRHVLETRGVSSDICERVSRRDPLTLDDIIELSQKGVPGPFIIHCLKPTDYDYHLSYVDAVRLQQSGVSEDVIRYLTATRVRSTPTFRRGMYPNDPVYNQFPGSYLRN